MSISVRSDPRIAQLRELLESIAADHSVRPRAVISALGGMGIPTSLFSHGLCPQEAVVKYLHENCSLSLSTIASILHRSRQGIWQAYKHACHKNPTILSVDPSEYTIPFHVFNKKHSILESVVLHLHKQHLRFCDIAKILALDSRTIWTIHSRAKKK